MDASGRMDVARCSESLRPLISHDLSGMVSNSIKAIKLTLRNHRAKLVFPNPGFPDVRIEGFTVYKRFFCN